MTIRLSQMAGVFAIAFAIGLGMMLYLSETLDARYWPLGVDVYSHTVHTRAFWEGRSPYSETVQLSAEELVYGRARRLNEPPFPFTYPAYLAFVLLPIIFLPPALVGVVWGAAMWAILTTVVAAWSLSLAPRPAPFVWSLLVLSILAFRPALLSIINGQYGLLVVGCTLLSWWLIGRKQDAWVGLLLALATVKPSVGMFLPSVLLIWALRWKHWKLMTSFMLAMMVLMGVTIVRIGWWVPDFLYHTITYSSLRQGIGLAWSLEQLTTWQGLIWLSLALGVLMQGAYLLWRNSHFPWMALIAALNLNLMLTPHTAEYDLVMMLIPLLWLGVNWRAMPWGWWGWMILIWMPWLSWVAVLATGGTIDGWWQLIWQFYPTLLLTAILLSLWREGTIRSGLANTGVGKR